MKPFFKLGIRETDPNLQTLSAYNKEVANYVKLTPEQYLPNHKPMLRWIHTALAGLNPAETILEIGSGTGRDANYIRSKGFSVVCSDGAKGFVNLLRKKGNDCLEINVLTDEIPTGFKLILANAVMSHFNKNQFQTVLKKIKSSLEEAGHFAFSVKEGHGEKWINEKLHSKRYVRYWQVSELNNLLKHTGWEIVFLERGIPGDLPSHTWINVIVKKTTVS